MDLSFDTVIAENLIAMFMTPLLGSRIGVRGQGLHHSRRPVPLHHPLARAQIGRRDPFSLHRVKRMRKRGFPRFPTNPLDTPPADQRDESHR